MSEAFFFFSQGKKFRYSLNYSEKQVKKAALGIVHKNMTIIIPPRKKKKQRLNYFLSKIGFEHTEINSLLLFSSSVMIFSSTQREET